jgi:ABC-type multidrug transport system fused ATPase/permease subunit
LHGPRSILRFAFGGLAVLMHATSHALVALCGSALAVSLVAGWTGRGHSSMGLGPGARLAGADPFWCAVAGLAVILVKSASGAYATFVQVRVAGEVGANLRLELFDALLALHRLRPLGHGDQGGPPRAAASVSRAVLALTESVRDIERGLARGVLGAARAWAQIAPLVVLLIILSPRMAAAAAVILAVLGLGLGRVRGRHRESMRRAKEDRARLVEASDESMRHAELWVSYGAEGKARESVERLGQAVAQSSAALEARAAALSGANEVLAAAALVGTLGAARAGWVGVTADGPTLVAFAASFFLAYRPVRDLGEARLALARASAAYEELRKLEGRLPGRSLGGVAPTAETSAGWRLGSLELRGLVLTRGACGPLSLRIEAGAVGVIVGRTGVGKTTLLRTLLGFERPAAGEIVYAGRSLGEAPAGPAGRPFAWVPQDAPVLADTLTANVGLGAARVDVQQVLSRFGAAHLVESLGAASLGAGARALSGGERQWIALARAVATEQPVLLLDEPTSGLDPAASRMVLDAIRHVRGQRTILLVTHRSEPLAVADFVVRLDEGTTECAA